MLMMLMTLTMIMEEQLVADYLQVKMLAKVRCRVRSV